MTNHPLQDDYTREWPSFNSKFYASHCLESFLQIFDRIVSSFLWGCCGCVALCAVFFSVTTVSAVVLACVYTFLSILGHIVHEAVSCWREFPYWRSIEQIHIDRRRVSYAILLPAAVISVSLAVNSGFGAAVVIFVYLFAVDYCAAVYAFRTADENVYSLRDVLESEFDKDCRIGESNSQTNVVNVIENNGASMLSPSLDSDPDSDETVLSTQTRTCAKNGEIRTSGQIIGSFAPGTELAVICISFCPPFEQVPEFQFETISDDEISVKETLVQPFGVRLEAKRRLTGTEEDAQSTGLFTIEYYAKLAEGLKL